MSRKSGAALKAPEMAKKGFCSGFESVCVRCDLRRCVDLGEVGARLMVTACVVAVAAFVQICPVSDSAMEMCGARSRRADAAARVNVAHVCIP